MHHMTRIGLRGRFITVYFHKYTNVFEKTERLHAHPFKLSISLHYRGWMREHRVWNKVRRVDGVFQRLFTREAPSVEIYRFTDQHRILLGKGRSIFVGLNRTQVESPNATVSTKQGFAHYSELNKTERDAEIEAMDRR